jgi:hypothetical protein
VIEYLSKLVNGAPVGGSGYKDFIKDYMAVVRPEYTSFTYASGDQDLPTQMYHILRCGIVHSYSFIPDPQAISHGGHDRSIVLSHRAEGLGHLSNYSSPDALDAANMVAEDFVGDIEATIGLIFSKAKGDHKLKTRIETWLTSYPPIRGNI